MKPFTNFFKVRYLQILLTALFVGFISINLSAQIAIDGNPSDWANFTTNPLYPTNAYSRDNNNTNDNQFSQGSKDGNDVTTWHWTNGQTNNKGDISNAGAILRNEGGINYLYFCGDRAVNNGDAAIGFWFFKNGVAPVGATSGTFSGAHANGDLLVVSHFTQGGGQAEIFIYKWMNGGLTAPVTSPEAMVNATSLPVPDGFRYASANYPIGDFFEGRVNLNSLGVAPCFANFLLETRNSQSITASLQDFSAGNFTQQTPPPDLAVDPPTCTTSTGTIRITSATTGLTFKLDNGDFLPYPADGYTVAANSTHTVTAQTADGCLSNPASASIPAAPANPERPVVTLQEATICGTVTTPTITVICPIAGTYRLTQGTTITTKTYPADNLVFPVQPGVGFSITVTTGTGANACTSDPTNCNNYTTNSCPSTLAAARIVDVAPAIQLETKLSVFPNPFNDKLKFSFKPAISGQATLDLYNMLGQKVKTVFQGNVVAGQVQNIEYNVPNAQRSNLIYMFRVGNQKLSGKLLGMK